MNKKTIYCNSYHDAFTAIADLIKSRKVDLTKKHIVLVPEKLTLFFEQLLFKGGGAFDVEVYSLSRWFLKLGGGNLISRSGAIMILKDILYQKDLKCFFRSKNFVGFAARLYQTICDLKENKIDPSNIKISGALGLKFEDIESVIQEFDKRTKNISVDKVGKIEQILKKLKNSDLLSSCHIYIAGFDRLTLAEKELFDYIENNSLSFVFTKVEGRKEITAKTEIYAANGIIGCLKAVAARIRELFFSGVSFSDMAIVAPTISFEQSRRILDENGIPFYVDNSIPLSHTKLFEYLECLFRLKKLNRQDFIYLSKNKFAGIDNDEADIFENYCKSFMIDYLGFSQPFTLTNSLKDPKKEEERLFIAEKVRKKLYQLVSSFWEKLNAARNANEFCTIINEHLDFVSEDCAEKERIKCLTQTIAQHLETNALNSRRLQFLIDALIEGAGAEQMSKLPRTQNCVLIGDAGIFKGGKYKYVFLVGFNEGKLPQLTPPSGLITDEEILRLGEACSNLKLKSEDDKQKEFELLQLLSMADNIFISYDISSDNRISPLIYTIIAETKDIIYSSSEKERLSALDGNIDDIIRLSSSKSAALEQLILHRNIPCVWTSSLLEALGGECQKYLFPPPTPKSISANIFFSDKSVSISQLQTYFSCPYKHFIQYGLYAKKPDSGKADVLDIGNAIHKINELYALSGFDDQKLVEIANEVFNQGKYTYETNKRLKDNLILEALNVCVRFGRHIKNGRYQMLGVEIKFGKNHKFRGCSLGDITLNGSIDYTDQKNGLIRIIDYKTYATKFSESELYYGIKLQLPLYMLTMVENGYSPAAMLYFVFKEKWGEKDYRFNGIFLADKEVLLDFDPNMLEENTVVPAKIKEKEKVSGTGAVSKQEFDAYLDYAKEVAKKAIEQIKSGNIMPSPFKSSNYFACEYCEYPLACGFCGQPRVAQKAKILTKED